MLVEALYDHGKLEFVPPLQLKNATLRLLVNVPDEEIEMQAPRNLLPEVVERAKATLVRMEAIRNAPLPPDSGLPELTEKQLERIEAFELRDEIKAIR